MGLFILGVLALVNLLRNLVLHSPLQISFYYLSFSRSSKHDEVCVKDKLASASVKFFQ